jgi:hypothetical protein
MTVARLLDEIGSRELVEWMAFAQLEPFGAPAEDFRAGLMPAITVDMHREQGTPASSPLDFFPWTEKRPLPEPPPLSPEEVARAIKAHVFGVEG